MSRLYDILNGIVAPFGKSLWSGTWSSGSQTIPSTDKYYAFIVTVAGSPMLAVKDEGVVIAYSITPSSTSGSSAQYIKAAVFNISGNTWTINRIKQLNHNETGTAHTASTTTLNVTRIVGLIPNWGGG